MCTIWTGLPSNSADIHHFSVVSYNNMDAEENPKFWTPPPHRIENAYSRFAGPLSKSMGCSCEQSFQLDVWGFPIISPNPPQNTPQTSPNPKTLRPKTPHPLSWRSTCGVRPARKTSASHPQRQRRGGLPTAAIPGLGFRA